MTDTRTETTFHPQIERWGGQLNRETHWQDCAASTTFASHADAAVSLPKVRASVARDRFCTGRIRIVRRTVTTTVETTFEEGERVAETFAAASKLRAEGNS